MTLKVVLTDHNCLEAFCVGTLKNRDLQVRSSALSNGYYDCDSVAMATTDPTGTCAVPPTDLFQYQHTQQQWGEWGYVEGRNGGERGSVFHDPLTFLFPSHVGGGARETVAAMCLMRIRIAGAAPSYQLLSQTPPQQTSIS